jgi:hypothetical protein
MKLYGLFGLFLLVFYGAGIAMLGYCLWAAWRSSQAASWPTVPGLLTRVELQERQDDEGTTYEVKVAYTYSVAGKAYAGNRLAFGYGGSSGCESHRQILDRLKAAETVDVRYNPANPAMSTLSYGWHRSLRFGMAFAFTWIAFTAGFTLIVWIASQPDTVLLDHLSLR